jgi:bacillithiol biosynthesis cysteine-adding enzyme BshC
MQATRIPYRQTQRFSKLVLDYIAQKEPITDFFGEQPGKTGFQNQINKKRDFPKSTRKILAECLKDQYSRLPLAATEKQQLFRKIDKLEDSRVFTVTTGHQLCLFTGPLYTVYKILHVIRLAEELSATLDGVEVLPIFWMATEDHDFDEVNHVRYQGQKLLWHHESGDAVGRMDTQGIRSVLEELNKRLPAGTHAESIINDLQAAYLRQHNLADATRAIVHKWFGPYGIVVIDADDARLKRLMIPAFTRELKEQISQREVMQTSEQLKAHYKMQVAPREINLFYLHEQQRSRIVREGDRYKALSGQADWSEAEIIAELEAHPERFSPNVLLRPLYQETILPNLGYIGGGGEVAYWAQLKSMFAAFAVPFPILLLRQSVQLVPRRIARKLQKLKLPVTALFADYHQLSKSLIREKYNFDGELDTAQQKLLAVYAEIAELAGNVDVNLRQHVEAQKMRTLNGLDKTEQKMFRAARRKDDDALRMFRESMDVLFPGGGLQERHDNIIDHFIQFGPGIIDAIYRQIDPLHVAFISMADNP